MSQAPIRAAGIPWYRREDWDELLRLFDDIGKMSKTYDDWLGRALAVESGLKRKGHIVVRAYIDPATFGDWCRHRGHNVDAKARTKYANAVALQHVKSTH